MSSASVEGARVQSMPRIEFIPTRSADGTVILRAALLGPVERLRRLVRRLVRA
jgi:hypothetical protein